jgi:hypothetical protein
MKLNYVARRGNKSFTKSVIVPNFDAYQHFIEYQNYRHAIRGTGFQFNSI